MTQNSRFPLNFPPPCVIFTFIKSTCIRYEYYIPVHVEMKQRAYKVCGVGRQLQRYVAILFKEPSHNPSK